MNQIVGKKIHINGIVQGVGFRPFVYTAATDFQISGWVRNSSSGVDILANGTHEKIVSFIERLKTNPPPLSKIYTLEVKDIEPDGFDSFEIIHSQSKPGDFVPISPDVSICEECSKELFNPLNRRYRYPFINCTNCGPRFTIIKDIPYDRLFTTMADFEMCDDCKSEYENPLDRRFHAQPVGCPNCGPKIWFEDRQGRKIYSEKGLQTARERIRNGEIIAVKGLGGFHLACDAQNKTAVEELRKRKKRTDKAFAVMVFNTEAAEKFCKLTTSERLILESRERPIVILKKGENCNLPQAIAPGNNTLGVMLPYSPFHLLIMEQEPGYPEILIMTSGNTSEEPIAYTNEGAVAKLNDIADAFVFNDRDIYMRLDDSVVFEVESAPYFIRRTRGYAPNPIHLEEDAAEILAVGAELKNTFCLTKKKYAFLSHHIGDLKNLETLRSLEEGIKHYENLFKVNPTIIAHDMHPDYLSTRYAVKRAQEYGVELIPVQHHHAHLAACLAENRWDSNAPVIGICFDGTGYGLDGKIWGGEFLLGGFTGFERAAHLAYMPLPGGDAAIRHPKKTAAAYLRKAGIPWDDHLPTLRAFSEEEISILDSQLEKNINCPETSSIGRLFDAVASLIGLRHSINYEAQAAIELELIADPDVEDAYDFPILDSQIQIEPLLSQILKNLSHNLKKSVISAKFHNGLVKLAVETCKKIRDERGVDTAALSGGVWQNRYLLTRTKHDLENAGFQVLIHSLVPANDGGLSLGQAVIANSQIRSE